MHTKMKAHMALTLVNPPCGHFRTLFIAIKTTANKPLNQRLLAKAEKPHSWQK